MPIIEVAKLSPQWLIAFTAKVKQEHFDFEDIVFDVHIFFQDKILQTVHFWKVSTNLERLD